MKEWIDLLSAATYFLLVLSGAAGIVTLAVLVARRPAWRASIAAIFRERAISVGPLSLGGPATLSPQSTSSPPPAPLQLVAATATGEAAPQAPDQPRKEHWFSLLQQGKYSDGIRLLREKAAKEDDPGKRDGLIAMGLYLAFEEGSVQAAEDLQDFADKHPESSEARVWLASVFSQTGRLPEAETALQEALTKAASDEARARVLRTHATMLSVRDRRADAIRLLTQALPSLKNPTARADLYAAIAENHLAAKPKATEDAMLAYELALRETPTDRDLRFTVAYKYSEHSAPGLALYHYRVLIDEHEPDAMTLNNAGVAAGELGLPTMAVDYFRRSQEKGETLAISNLASRLLTAGFRKESEDLLRSVIVADGVNPRVPTVLAEVMSAREAEETKLKDQSDTISRVRRWRVRYAEAALADAVDPALVAGQYGGTPSLALTVDSGKVSGTFEVSNMFGSSAASLEGSLRGRAIAFTWRVVEPQMWSNPKDGHGLLIWSDQRLSGFRVSGPRTMDAVRTEHWSVWELTKQTV